MGQNRINKQAKGRRKRERKKERKREKGKKQEERRKERRKERSSKKRVLCASPLRPFLDLRTSPDAYRAIERGPMLLPVNGQACLHRAIPGISLSFSPLVVSLYLNIQKARRARNAQLGPSVAPRRAYGAADAFALEQDSRRAGRASSRLACEREVTPPCRRPCCASCLSPSVA